MLAALINRSLTNVRTELEFLLDSEVIDQQLYDKLMASLPQRYTKDMPPWGVDRLASGTDDVAAAMAKTSLRDEIAPPAHPPSKPLPPRAAAAAIGYCRASYNYDAREKDDLSLEKGDRIAVLEHLSPDWWKGYKQGNPGAPGVFPLNYVAVISEAEFNSAADRALAQLPEKATYTPDKASYTPDASYQNGPPLYNPSPQGQYQQPASYGGYAQFPPPSANYYPPQQQVQAQPEQVQQQHLLSNGHLKKFGSKLGNAAIFGAGATIGSDIVNLIF